MVKTRRIGRRLSVGTRVRLVHWASPQQAVEVAAEVGTHLTDPFPDIEYLT